MRKADYRRDGDHSTLWKVKRAKDLDCGHCPPNKKENRGRVPKHGARPPKSKNRKGGK